MTQDKENVWECKIGFADGTRLPMGADLPLRRAVERAYQELTGEAPKFIFSGWGATLTSSEEACVNGMRQ